VYPYLSREGFTRRTVLPTERVRLLESSSPGWIDQNLMSWQSRINAQLRKRYGNARRLGRDSLPLGQDPPVLLAAGTMPPALALTGRPVLGCFEMRVQITTAGALTVAILQWSDDGGRSWTTDVASAAAIVLGRTGMTLVMPAGAYGADNVYAAATPVPETVLQWQQILCTWDCYQKLGRNPSDPFIDDLRADRERVLKEIEQAANSKDGLFDLPVSDDADSAVTTAGPLAYTENSPYVGADIQERLGRAEDARDLGIGGY
jgi:hypothetical protein